MKINNPNDYSKRTAIKVNAILKSCGINERAENLGDGRKFSIMLHSNLKNRYALKRAGFILCQGTPNEKFIDFKAY